MSLAGKIGSEEQTQSGCMPHRFSARERAFLEIHQSFGPRFRDDSCQELCNAGIVPHDHDGFMAGIFFQHTAGNSESPFRAPRPLPVPRSLITEFVADQRSSLSSALQGAGDNYVGLNVECGQGASHESALLNAVGVERALLVLLGIRHTLPGACVSDEVNNHELLAAFRNAGRRDLRSGTLGMAAPVCLPSARARRKSWALKPGAGGFLLPAACHARM